MISAVTPRLTALLGGSAGSGELLLLFVVVLILFGPRRIPEAARMIGRVLHELRRAANEFRDQIMTLDADERPAASGTPKPMIPDVKRLTGSISRSAPDIPASDSTQPTLQPEAPSVPNGGDGPKEGASGRGT